MEDVLVFICKSWVNIQNRVNLPWWNIFGPVVFEVCLILTSGSYHGSHRLVVYVGYSEAMPNHIILFAGRLAKIGTSHRQGKPAFYSTTITVERISLTTKINKRTSFLPMSFGQSDFDTLKHYKMDRADRGNYQFSVVRISNSLRVTTLQRVQTRSCFLRLYAYQRSPSHDLDSTSQHNLKRCVTYVHTSRADLMRDDYGLLF